MAKTIILFGDVLTLNGILENCYVTVVDKKISSISSRKPDSKSLKSSKKYSFKGKTLIPGLIDLHVHGILENDLLSGDEASVIKMSKILAMSGVTGFLPTLWTAPKDDIVRGIRGIVSAKGLDGIGAKILGIHLEGPFISESRAGAQDFKHIIPPQIDILNEFIKNSEKQIKIVTLAPEIEGGNLLVKQLKRFGITSSLGHSNANFEQAVSAIKNGIRYATHIGNAMRPIHQRDPGAICALLFDPRVYVEIIPDGVHLHPAFVRMVLQLKGLDRVIGVTDSLTGVPNNSASFVFGGRGVLVKDDRFIYSDYKLAGSRLTMNFALKKLIDFTGKDMCDIIKLLTVNPAKVLGLEKIKGSIETGKDADIAVIDDKFDVLMTMVEGKVVYA